MKKMTKFLALAIMMLAFTAGTFAQVSATASATATIITPIAITKTTDMNFGNIAVNASGGTVVLTPAGGRSTTSGCTLPAATGTVTAASFTVTGEGTSTYVISLPANHTITRVSGTETMIVDVFASTPSGTGALTGGTQTLLVGATLNVGVSQVPGSYTNVAGFTVTVNYN